MLRPRPTLEILLNLETFPKSGDGRSQLRSVGSVARASQGQREPLKGRKHPASNLLKSNFKVSAIFQAWLRLYGISQMNWFVPDLPFPASRQGLIFEQIDFLIFGWNQAALQGGKPILMLPVECYRPQGTACQLG